MPIRIRFGQWIYLLHTMVFILCCVFGFVHILITVLQGISFSRYKPKNSESTHAMSIIIAAHNEESNLKKLIPALLTQNHKKFEIIVALDRCTDQSKQYLDSYKLSNLQFVDIQTVDKRWNPKKFALDQAIAKANGEWLVFTDADCLPESNEWLKEFNKQVSDDTDIIIGVSPYQSSATFLSNYIRFEGFMTAFYYVSRALQKRPYMAVGRNMAIRKSFFHSVGGYESFKSVTGGDDDLFVQHNAGRTNTSVVLGKLALVQTFPKKNWNAYWNQKLRHLSVGVKYKKADQLFLGITHFSHLTFLTLLISSATHSFFFPLLLFYLFIKLVSYRFAASKMEININYILLPLVDIIYAMLIPVIALQSKLEKDIKWKN